MRFSVKFDRPSFRLSLHRRLNYLGKGHLHLQETGLVLDGNLLKFRLPAIDRFYHPIISTPSIRTIPYSTITGHQHLSYWPTLVGKATLLLILLVVFSALIFGLTRGGNWIIIGISLIVVTTLIVLTCFIGKRFQRIIFRMPDGKSCRVIFSTRFRNEAVELAGELQRYMAIAKSLCQETSLPERPETKGPGQIAPSPEPEATLADRAPPSPAGKTGVGDGATPRIKLREDRPAREMPSHLSALFEVRCPSCGRPRKILNAAMIGKSVRCLECATEYVVRPLRGGDAARPSEAPSTDEVDRQLGPRSPQVTEPPSEESEYRLMDEPDAGRAETAWERPASGLRGERPTRPSPSGRPAGAPTVVSRGIAGSAGWRSRLARSARSFLLFALWTGAGAVICALIHLGLQSRHGQRDIRGGAILGWVSTTFYYPGNQLYALGHDFPTREVKGGWRGRIRPHLPAAYTVLFWALVCGFLGWFSRIARPESARFGDQPEAFWVAWLRWAGVPIDHLGEARVWITLAAWLLVLGGAVLLGLLGRELVQHQADKIEQRTEERGTAWGGSGLLLPGGGWTRYPAYDDERAEWVTDLNNHLRQGQQLTEQGGHVDAQQHYEKALVLLGKLRRGPHRDIAVVHHNLALNLHQQQLYVEAAEHYEQALEILLEIGQGKSREAALVYGSFARNLDEQGKYDEARQHYEKSLAIVKELVGEEHPDTAVVQMGLAQHFDRQGKHPEARSQFDRAIKILLAQPEQSKVQEKAMCLLGSGANLLALGRYEEAKDQLAEAWKMARTAPDKRGPLATPRTGPDSQALALKDLLARGQQFDEQDKPFDAQSQYREALDLLHDSRQELRSGIALVLNMQETAAVHHRMAQSLWQQGNYVKADEHFEKALERLVAVGKEESQETAMLHNNWAQSLDQRNKPTESLTHYEKALAIVGSVLGSEHPDAAVVRMNMGQHFDLQGEHQKARSYHDGAVRILLAEPEGSRSREKAMCLVVSGYNLLALARYGEAHRHAVLAGRIARTESGGDDRYAALAAGLRVQTLGVPIGKYLPWMIVLSLALVIAWHAGRRGYSPLLWLFATLASAYPLANLAVLASLENRTRQMRRANISRQLEGLTDQPAIGSPPKPPSGRSIGDQTTRF